MRFLTHASTAFVRHQIKAKFYVIYFYRLLLFSSLFTNTQAITPRVKKPAIKPRNKPNKNIIVHAPYL